MKAQIHFFTEDVDFKIKKKTLLRKWISDTIRTENHFLGELNFILCSDEYLLKINQEYLNHDTYTDIITFDGGEEETEISGDIFISIQRVKENAETLQFDIENELHRVIIHGVLHLLGYPDKGTAEKKMMREKEDYYLLRYADLNQQR